MDAPLTKWYCDVCRKKIDKISDGYVIWKSGKLTSYGFKIIHKTKCDLQDYISSGALESFFGVEGLVKLTAMLSPGPIIDNSSNSSSYIQNDNEFVDLVRRIQIPYYEEARRRFQKPDLREVYGGPDEVSPYFPENLRKMIEEYPINND